MSVLLPLCPLDRQIPPSCPADKPVSLTEKADAEKITIPHIVLASKDEPAEAIADYKKIIDTGSIGGYVETYETVHHGWMAARADLEVEHERSEYTRG